MNKATDMKNDDDRIPDVIVAYEVINGEGALVYDGLDEQEATAAFNAETNAVVQLVTYVVLRRKGHYLR